MKSWGFLEDVCEAEQLVNMTVQQHGYVKADHEHAAA
jgi:hypothetical protein